LNIPIGDIGLDESQHLFGCFGHLDEYTVVDLEETKELEDLFRLGCEVVDTKDGVVNIIRPTVWS